MRVVNVMISKVKGGVEQASVDYANALAGLGHDVLFVLDKKTQTTFVPNEKITPWYIRFNQRNLFLLFPIYRKLKEFKPDVVILHSKKAISFFNFVAKRLNIKTIAVAHNPKIKRIDKCDAIFSITKIQKNIFAEHGLSNVFVVPNMMNDHRDFVKMPSFKNPPVIGVMGRFDPMKGFVDFIKALGILKKENVAFKGIIGGAPDGKYPEEYERVLLEIKNQGIEHDVELKGWFSNKDDFYDQIDIFVLPSNFEPFGIVLLEAMVRSKPVVSALAEGPSEIFANNEVAFTYPVKDYKALAEQLKIALTDERQTAIKAKQGYDLIQQRYLLEKVAVVLEQNIKSVLGV